MEKGSQKLPVVLNLTEEGAECGCGAPRYESVTKRERDAAFEAKVQALARLPYCEEKKSTAALYISFPLRINQGGKSRMISSAPELTAQWNEIFTPHILRRCVQPCLTICSPETGRRCWAMGWHESDSKGAVALNLP